MSVPAEHAEPKGPHAPVPTEEIVRRGRVQPVRRVEDLAVPGLFESDAEVEAFKSFVRAQRRAEPV